MAANSTTRFSRTVQNYLRYRPGYPPELLTFMQKEMGLSTDATIADIGSGTGKLTILFLKNGNPTFAVEPNREMREAAEQLLKYFPNFHSINGTAEATTLPSAYADFIIAAQAFHWFDQQKTRQEFLRIGKPGAKTLLIWNDRADDKSAFMQAYNGFLYGYSTDLTLIDHRNIGALQFDAFFGKGNWQEWQFDFAQSFDFEGVKGRYLSCSYAFDENHPRHTAAINALKATFDAHSENGRVEMWYRTMVFYGVILPL